MTHALKINPKYLSSSHTIIFCFLLLCALLTATSTAQAQEHAEKWPPCIEQGIKTDYCQFNDVNYLLNTPKVFDKRSEKFILISRRCLKKYSESHDLIDGVFKNPPFPKSITMQLGVSYTEKGKANNVTLISSSGYPSYDQKIMDHIQEDNECPEPPKEILNADGIFALTYQLHFDFPHDGSDVEKYDYENNVLINNKTYPYLRKYSQDFKFKVNLTIDADGNITEITPLSSTANKRFDSDIINILQAMHTVAKPPASLWQIIEKDGLTLTLTGKKCERSKDSKATKVATFDGHQFADLEYASNHISSDPYLIEATDAIRNVLPDMSSTVISIVTSGYGYLNKIVCKIGVINEQTNAPAFLIIKSSGFPEFDEHLLAALHKINLRPMPDRLRHELKIINFSWEYVYRIR